MASAECVKTHFFNEVLNCGPSYVGPQKLSFALSFSSKCNDRPVSTDSSIARFIQVVTKANKQREQQQTVPRACGETGRRGTTAHLKVWIGLGTSPVDSWNCVRLTFSLLLSAAEDSK